MIIPRSYIENYSKAISAVADQAKASLIEALSGIDYTADIEDIRNAVIAVMQQYCGASSTLSARLAAEFYDGLRLQFGIVDGYSATINSLRDAEATSGAVRAFVQDLVDGKPVEEFINKCASRIDYETRKAANECVAFNGRRDPEKPRWARVPVGVETCQFCLMLASRGFDYRSESTASHAHANCDCKVVPSWDKRNPAIQGYDPDYYYAKWQESIDKQAEERANRKGTAEESERSKIMSYYAESSKTSKGRKGNEWFFAERDGLRGFDSFRDVQLWLMESSNKEELEQRFSSLANRYGTQALKNQRLIDAAKHAEKRFK